MLPWVHAALPATPSCCPYMAVARTACSPGCMLTCPPRPAAAHTWLWPARDAPLGACCLARHAQLLPIHGCGQDGMLPWVHADLPAAPSCCPYMAVASTGCSPGCMLPCLPRPAAAHTWLWPGRHAPLGAC